MFRVGQRRAQPSREQGVSISMSEFSFRFVTLGYWEDDWMYALFFLGGGGGGGDRFPGMIMVSHLLRERFALAGHFARYQVEPPESVSKLPSEASGTLYLRRIMVVLS